NCGTTWSGFVSSARNAGVPSTASSRSALPTTQTSVTSGTRCSIATTCATSGRSPSNRYGLLSPRTDFAARRSPAATMAGIPIELRRALLEDEDHLKRHEILGDASVLDARLLLDDLDPGDVAQRLARALEAAFDRVLPADRRGRRDRRDRCDRHGVPPTSGAPSRAPCRTRAAAARDTRRCGCPSPLRVFRFLCFG